MTVQAKHERRPERELRAAFVCRESWQLDPDVLQEEEYFRMRSKFNPARDSKFELECGHTAYPADLAMGTAGTHRVEYYCEACKDWRIRKSAAARRAQSPKLPEQPGF